MAEDTSAKNNAVSELVSKTLGADRVRYIYSMKDCPKCDKLKNQLREEHATFIERSGERLSGDTRIMDNIDKEAHLKLQMQNLTFPVDITIMCDDD